VPSWQRVGTVQQEALACVGKGLCVRHGGSRGGYFFQVISMLLRSEKPFI
jgi:hypothetical protein